MSNQTLLETFGAGGWDQYVANQIQKQTHPAEYIGKRSLDFTPFEDALSHFTSERYATLHPLIFEATIAQLRVHLAQGRFTVTELTLYYLHRIYTFDRDQLNSVLELNPDALTIAQSLDSSATPVAQRPPLWGLPILLKDNIATGDNMHTTAGAKALESARAKQDSFVAGRLRAAGAIFLGKTNLSEWANFMTSTSNNGFSVLGGQTHNPYGAFDCGGSSSGSAVAAAMNFAAATIGSETSGSITYPSGLNAVVGVKPSLGRVSRSGVIPITDAMDTLGPMTRTVTDAAILLDVIAAADPRDPLTYELAPFATATSLASGVERIRFGVCQPDKDLRTGDHLIFSQVTAALQSVPGFTVKTGLPTPLEVSYIDVLHYGMKPGVAAYLQDYALETPIQTLQDVLTYNIADLPNRAPYGQDLMEKTCSLTITEPDYQAWVQRNRQTARLAMHRVLIESEVDIVVSLSNMHSETYAPAGCPVVVVPGGYRASGEPVGVALIGVYGDDQRVIRAAYALEQIMNARISPKIG